MGRPTILQPGHRHRAGQYQTHAPDVHPRGHVGADVEPGLRRTERQHAPVADRLDVVVRRAARGVHQREAGDRTRPRVKAARHREPHQPRGVGVAAAPPFPVGHRREHVVAVGQHPAQVVDPLVVAEQRVRRLVLYSSHRRRSCELEVHAPDVRRIGVQVRADVDHPAHRRQVQHAPVLDRLEIGVGRAALGIHQRKAGDRRDGVVQRKPGDRRRRTGRAAPARLRIGCRHHRIGALGQLDLHRERRRLRGERERRRAGHLEADAAHPARAGGVRPQSQRRPLGVPRLDRRAVRQHRQIPPSDGRRQRQPGHRDIRGFRRAGHREACRARRQNFAGGVRGRRRHRVGPRRQAAAAVVAVKRVRRPVARASRGLRARQRHGDGVHRHARRQLGADVERPRGRRVEIDDRALFRQFHQRRGVRRIHQLQPRHRRRRLIGGRFRVAAQPRADLRVDPVHPPIQILLAVAPALAAGQHADQPVLPVRPLPEPRSAAVSLRRTVLRLDLYVHVGGVPTLVPP